MITHNGITIELPVSEKAHKEYQKANRCVHTIYMFRTIFAAMLLREIKERSLSNGEKTI